MLSWRSCTHLRQIVQKTRLGSTSPMSGSERNDAARCSALRRRDSCEGAKLNGVRSLNDAGETGDVNGEVSVLLLFAGGGGGAADWAGAADTEEDDTMAMRCFDGGGTLFGAGMLNHCERDVQ